MALCLATMAMHTAPRHAGLGEYVRSLFSLKQHREVSSGSSLTPFSSSAGVMKVL